MERFSEEIQQQSYDVIGISGIIANVGKVAKMCELIRQYQPGATIIVAGTSPTRSSSDQLIDADLVVPRRGDPLVPALPRPG